MTPLAGWENSYVIVGSSAGALIGLQFVMITLVANAPMRPGQELIAAAAVLLLLFIGIHNAWDAVTYHVFSKEHGEVGQKTKD